MTIYLHLWQDLAFKYTWNNLLHTQVEQCLAIVLQDESSEDEEEEHKENPLLSQVSNIMMFTGAHFST